MLARRIPHDLSPNELTRAVEAARLENRRVLDLTLTERNAVGLPPPTQEELGALGDPRVARYDPDPRGALEAREAIAGYYAEREGSRRGGQDPARIVLTAGTSEAYAHLFRLLCNAGDEVLIPSPSYPLFDPIARLEEVVTKPYRLAYGDGWRLDVESLHRCIRPRTRAIVLVEPNNPTGSCLTEAERRDVVAVCAERGVALIVDEVFGDFPWREGETLASLAGESGALTFALNGISKSCGLPQLKLGWIAVSGPDTDVAAAGTGLEWIADLFLTVSAPPQWALSRLLAARSSFQEAARHRVRENLALLRRAASDPGGFTVLEGDGGWTAVLRFDSGDDELALRALAQHEVLVQPGHYYDLADTDIVVSLMTPTEITAEALRRLAKVSR